MKWLKNIILGEVQCKCGTRKPPSRTGGKPFHINVSQYEGHATGTSTGIGNFCTISTKVIQVIVDLPVTYQCVACNASWLKNEKWEVSDFDADLQ